MTIDTKLDEDYYNVKYITSVEQIENMDADDVRRLTQNFAQVNVRLLLDVCSDAETQMSMLNAILFAKTVIDTERHDTESSRSSKTPRIEKITAGHDQWWEEYRFLLKCNRRIELTDPLIPLDGGREMSYSDCATHDEMCSLGESFRKYRSDLGKPTAPPIIVHESNEAELSPKIAVYPSEPLSEETDQNAVIAKCFTSDTDGMKSIVQSIIKEHGFLNGNQLSGTCLARIEAVFFNHRVIKEPNNHKNFIDALVAWGIIDGSDENINKIYSQLSSKYSDMRVINSDYKQINNKPRDLACCNNIASLLNKLAPNYQYCPQSNSKSSKN